MFTYTQIEKYTSMTLDLPRTTRWVEVDKSDPSTFPPCEGVWEIHQDSDFLEPGEPPTMFMHWSPTDRLKLVSVDPRSPDTSIFAGAGFKWRGLKEQPQ